MKKIALLKLSALFVLSYCLCVQPVNAQRRNNNQHSQNNQDNNNQNNNNNNNNNQNNSNNNNNQNNKGKSGDEFPTLRRVRPHNEVKAQPEKSKEKSNDPNYDSNGILRFSAGFMRWWNENITPGSGTPENPSYPDNNSSGHGPFFSNAGNGYNASDALAKNYYLSYGIGIGISMKGGKFKGQDGNATETLWYIQIPLMARFNYVLDNGGTAFIGAGPYYGIAVSGNYKDNEGKGKLKFGNSFADGDDYRRGDIGLKIGLGYKLQSHPIFLGLTTDIGLRNISVGGDKEVKIKNQSIGLMIGYVFE